MILRKSVLLDLDFPFTEFSEARGFLGTLTRFVPWRIYIPLSQEYHAFVTWPAEAT